MIDGLYHLYSQSLLTSIFTYLRPRVYDTSIMSIFMMQYSFLIMLFTYTKRKFKLKHIKIIT